MVVILGLLAGFVAPRYFDQVGKSKLAKAQIDSLEKALDQYRLDLGHYPGTELGPAAPVSKPTAEGEAKWQGPTLKKRCPATRGSVRICTARLAKTRVNMTSFLWEPMANWAAPSKTSS